MNFMGINLADLGAHAEQLKTLVTGLLTSTQESRDASRASADNSDKVLEAVSLLHGAVSVLSDRVTALENAFNGVDSTAVLEVTGSGQSSQRPDDSV